MGYGKFFLIKMSTVEWCDFDKKLTNYTQYASKGETNVKMKKSLVILRAINKLIHRLVIELA